MSLTEPITDSLISIKGLSVTFDTPRGLVYALNDVNLELRNKEAVGIVGESGCGKTTLGLSLIGLLPMPPARISSGSILYKNTNIANLDKKKITSIRGTEIFMIFQEPMTSLNPVLTIEDQLAEAVKVRAAREDKRSLSKKEIHEGLVSSLESVKISDPERVLAGYPHQLSGGMRQRLMISMALLLKPSLIIADEPTTALDVTTQEQIMVLLKELQSKLETSILFITHDLNLVRSFAQRIVVMYAGEIVEEGTSEEIIRQPKHPYTQGLVQCIPKIYKSQGNLETIPGTVPDLMESSTSCKFLPRCKFAFERCKEKPSLYQSADSTRKVRCFLYE